MNKIYYKSLFRGWVEITQTQKDKLIKHLNNGITTMSGVKKQNYIDKQFKTL
jgi:hypothetical protein